MDIKLAARKGLSNCRCWLNGVFCGFTGKGMGEEQAPVGWLPVQFESGSPSRTLLLEKVGKGIKIFNITLTAYSFTLAAPDFPVL
jgi:hypothetical protein